MVETHQIEISTSGNSQVLNLTEQVGRCLADGNIRSGIVTVFAAADSFQLLAHNGLDERCLATPAIAGGQLFIRTEKHLYCIPGE